MLRYIPMAGDPYETVAWHALEGEAETGRKLAIAALKNDPANPWLHVLLANALARLQRGDEAHETLAQAVRLGCAERLARWTAARIERKAGDSKKAVPILRSLLADQPDSAPRYFELGELLFAHGNRSEALKLLRKAVSLEPDMARAWYVLGLIAVDEKDLGAAEAHFRKCLTLDLTMVQALGFVAFIHYQRGQIGEARRRAWETLCINPAEKTALLTLRCLVLNLVRFEPSSPGALKDPEDPRPPPERHRLAEGLDDSRVAADRRPFKDPRPLARQALQHLRDGQIHEARDVLARALRRDPGHARSIGLLAIVTCSLGTDREALELADKALASDPQDPAARLVCWFLRPVHKPLVSQPISMPKLDL